MPRYVALRRATPALPEAGYPKNYQRLDGRTGRPHSRHKNFILLEYRRRACCLLYTFLSPFPVSFHSFSPSPPSFSPSLSFSHIFPFTSPSLSLRVPSLSFFVSFFLVLSFYQIPHVILITPIDRLRCADNAPFCTVFALSHHCRGKLKFKRNALVKFLFTFF